MTRSNGNNIAEYSTRNSNGLFGNSTHGGHWRAWRAFGGILPKMVEAKARLAGSASAADAVCQMRTSPAKGSPTILDAPTSLGRMDMRGLPRGA